MSGRFYCMKNTRPIELSEERHRKQVDENADENNYLLTNTAQLMNTAACKNPSRIMLVFN